ncbi:MAG: hypothetical protein R3F14_34225 [Polyangiaceae bacterium]
MAAELELVVGDDDGDGAAARELERCVLRRAGANGEPRGPRRVQTAMMQRLRGADDKERGNVELLGGGPAVFFHGGAGVIAQN